MKRFTTGIGVAALLATVAGAQDSGRTTGIELLPEFREIDGSGNNPLRDDQGAAGTPFLRVTTVSYTDGAHEPSGAHLRSAREISNLVSDQEASIPSASGASDFVWQWGQFLDHDIGLTPVVDPAEPFDIPVPLGDPWFDPFGTGQESIPLDRSFYLEQDGVRQQVNDITTYIDASNVYGSDAERAAALRTLDGSGRLKMSRGRLLPFNVEGLPNAPTALDPSYFLAGDFRANEQVGLISMHTLFVREHNYWAARIRRAFLARGRTTRRPRAAKRGAGRRLRRADRPRVARADFGETRRRRLTGDEIYQMARAIVAAELQAITYREFLPVMLGEGALEPYAGYREDVDASLRNVFATAAYRVGHTMLSPTLLRRNRRGATIAAGDLSLAAAFFSPGEVVENGGIEPILRGLAAQTSQEVDAYLVDEVRNLLFGPPGSGGLDLAALNIQRGRDHGLPGYNQVRRDYGMPAAASFADISSDAEVRSRLAAAYDSVEDVDAWVGALAEDHVPGALVGESCRQVLSQQFEALRDGDRFWYQSYLPPALVDLVEQQTLARIIRRNTRIRRELPADVWHVSAD